MALNRRWEKRLATHTALAARPVPAIGNALTMFAVGSLVAGYRIEECLATGATGTVYLAKNPILPRRDALKVLSADLSQDPHFRERFVREADIASLLDHPNIVSIYNRGEADNGQLWIAMQYVAGTDAEAALQAGTMTSARASRIVGEVAKALDYAHQRNVVHHDVKPGNVLLSNDAHDDEHVLLSDFGVARAIGNPDNPRGCFDPGRDARLRRARGHHRRARRWPCRRLLIGLHIVSAPQRQAALLRRRRNNGHGDRPSSPNSAPTLGLPTRASPQLDTVMAKALAKNPAERFDSARSSPAPPAKRCASRRQNHMTSPIDRYPSGTSRGAALVNLQPQGYPPGMPGPLLVSFGFTT